MRVEIIGGMGAGKTTLCQQLQHQGVKCIFEKLQNNPYLELSYKDPQAFGFYSQMTFVLGNSHHINASLLMPANSIAASIANEFAEATTPMYQSALLALGFVLFIVTFVVLAIAKLMLMRLAKREGN